MEGIAKTEFCYIDDGSVAAWETLLQRTTPHVVLVRAMIMNEQVAEIMAIRHPDVQFVHICHSAFAFATTERGLYPRIAAIIQLSGRYKNVHYAHPNKDEVKAFRAVYCNAGCSILWLPNVVKHVDLPRKSFDRRKVCVFLTCVWRPLKNMVGQMLAVAAAAHSRERGSVRLFLSIPSVGKDGFITRMLDTINAIPDFAVNMVDWQQNEDYLEWMALHADIVMQCSFTESFNYVAWEAMDLGIPVIGSAAIPFASVVVNPDSIMDMANAIGRVMHDYKRYSYDSRLIAGQMGVEMNEAFVRTLSNLLERN